MTTWIAVAGVGLGSYALRLLPMLLGDRVRWASPVDRAISNAGLAALTALVIAGVQHRRSGRLLAAEHAGRELPLSPRRQPGRATCGCPPERVVAVRDGRVTVWPGTHVP